MAGALKTVGTAIFEGADKLYHQYGVPFVDTVLGALGKDVDPVVAKKAVQAEAKVQGIKPRPLHEFMKTEVPKVAHLPGKGGKSRRKTTPAQVRDEIAARTRAEAKARLAVKDPVARRAIRDEYTIGPPSIDADPELQRFSLKPGNQQSVTSQAMELGVPVQGVTPFYTQHPSGYSTSWGDNAPTPMNVTGTYRNRTPEPDVPMLNEGDIPIGAGLYRMLGDASMGNKDVLSVNGVKLVNPVSTLAGARYGYQEHAIDNPLVWASDVGVQENDARMIRDWQNENPGMPVIGMHVNMGATGSDFSHQTANILANLIPNLGLSGDKLRAIDDYIRAGADGLPDFEGFAENPALGLFDIVSRPGGDRKRVTKRLANVTKEAQLAGVPGHLGALARLAIAEQGLRLAPQGSTGFSVVQIDPENFLRVDPALLSGTKRKLFEGTNEYGGILGELPKFMRPDYNSGFSGINLGQMQTLVPAEIPFGPVFDRAKQFTKEGKPTTTTMKFKSFATDPNSIVTYTPEIQDKLGQYLHDVAKYKRLGWAEGGLAELADRYED